MVKVCMAVESCSRRASSGLRNKLKEEVAAKASQGVRQASTQKSFRFEINDNCSLTILDETAAA